MKCEICEKREATDVHHIDENHKNNDPDNLQNLCAFCHAEIHGNSPKKSELRRLVYFRDRAIKLRNAFRNQIRGMKKIEYRVPDEWEELGDKLDDIIKQKEKEIAKLLEEGDYPILDWLTDIKGINHNTSGKLISHIDIKKTPKISSLWRYCGYGYIKNGKAQRRKKGMSEEEAKKFGSPYLKKEMYILADSFIKQRTPKYRDIYDESKEEELEREYKEGYLYKKYNGYKKADKHLLRGHAHNRAIRKMTKRFLSDLWVEWRKREGLEVTKPYALAKLDHNDDKR